MQSIDYLYTIHETHNFMGVPMSCLVREGNFMIKFTLPIINILIDALELQLKVWKIEEERGEILEADLSELPNDIFTVEILIKALKEERERI